MPVNAQDTGKLNLPVDSQTDISAKLLKQSSMARRICVTYVNSRPPVRGPVSVRYQVLTPQVRARRPVPNGIALGDLPGVEQMELDFPYNVGDAGLARFPGGEVAGFL